MNESFKNTSGNHLNFPDPLLGPGVNPNLIIGGERGLPPMYRKQGAKLRARLQDEMILAFAPPSDPSTGGDQPAKKKDSKAQQENIETIDQSKIIWETNGDKKQPARAEYPGNVSFEFRRHSGIVKEIALKMPGEDSLWLTEDGINFKLKGESGVSAKITFDKGKIVIDGTNDLGDGKKSEFHIEFLTNGDQDKRLTLPDKTLLRALYHGDQTGTEETVFVDRTKIVKVIDKTGCIKVSIFAPDKFDDPAVIYERDPKAQRTGPDVLWKRTDCSKQPAEESQGKLSDGPDGKPKFEVLAKVEKVEPVVKKLLTAEELERVTKLQEFLIKQFPATISGKLKKAASSADREVISRLALPKDKGGEGFPDEPSKYTKDQLNKYLQEKNIAVRAKQDEVLIEFRRKLELLEAEKGKAFGEGTKAVYREYTQWLVREGIPATQELQKQFQKLPPPDGPNKLASDVAPGQDGRGRDMGPRDPRTYLNELGKGITDLKLDTEGIPTTDELQELGKTLLWMRESVRLLDQAHLNYDNTVVLRTVRRLEGLPAGWDVDCYPGADMEAYRAEFMRASNVAFRVRNLLALAIDSDRLNFANSKSIEQIRKELHIPDRWKIDFDPDTKKIRRLDLGLPSDLCLSDPANKKWLDEASAWLAKDGERIRGAVLETIAKQNNPGSFLYWGEVEIPKGYKVLDGADNAVECNLLWSEFDAKPVIIDGKQKYEVTYTMQPKNSHFYSYLNLWGLTDVGQPLKETRIMDGDDLVMVRRGLDSVEPMPVRELGTYRSHCQGWYVLEKGSAIVMDVGMVISGLEGVRAARAAATASEATLKISASELGWQVFKSRIRMGLGLTGLLNNAYFKHNDVGLALLNLRGGVIAFDNAAGVVSGLRGLAGLSNTASTAYKVSQAAKSLPPGLFTGICKANHVSMFLANGGFGAILYEDLRKQILRPDLEESLAPFRFAHRILSSDPEESRFVSAAKRLESYRKHLDFVEPSKKDADKIIADATALLIKPELEKSKPEYSQSVQKFQESMMTIINDGKADKDLRLLAICALMEAAKIKDGQLPDDVFVTRKKEGDGKETETLKRADLLAILNEDSSRIGTRGVLADELRVQLKDLSPIEYGKSLKAILDDQNVADKDKMKTWAKDRLKFVDEVNDAVFGKYDPKIELELARRKLDSYEKLLCPSSDGGARSIQRIVATTKRLLELRENDPDTYEKEVKDFKAELIGYFRTGTGQEIADECQRLSQLAGDEVTINDDDKRAADLKPGKGPRVNGEVRTVSAAALLLLARDQKGKVDFSSVIAERELDVPEFTYTKRITEEDDEGRTKVEEKETTVASHKHKQRLLVEDILTSLKEDLSNKNCPGPRRLVAADMLIDARQIERKELAALLRRQLVPETNMRPGDEEKTWALERIGFVANAQRVNEAARLGNLLGDADIEARAQNFLVSFSDLQNAVRRIATNPEESADNRALAGAILRALKEDPETCHKQLIEVVDDWREIQRAGAGEYAKHVVNELKQQLTAENSPDCRFKAALVLDDIGQITKQEFNAIMLGCIDKKNSALAVEAVKVLKLDQPDSLSKQQRAKLQAIIAEKPGQENIPIKIALCARINSIATQEERKQVAGSITPQLFMSADYELREALVTALGEMGVAGSEHTILPSLDPALESSGRVRLAALNALVKMNYVDLEPYLRRNIFKELDPPVRARMDDILFSSRKPPDTDIYSLRWKEADVQFRKILPESKASTHTDVVQKYLEEKGKWRSPRGNDGNCLTDLENSKNQDWDKYAGVGTASNVATAVGNFGRGTWYIVKGAATLGHAINGKEDLTPYDDHHKAAARAEWNKAALDALNQIGADAQRGDRQAILTLGYLAATNCDKLDEKIKIGAVSTVCNYLNSCAKEGHADKQAVIRALDLALTSNIATPELKIKLLEGLSIACTTAAKDEPTAMGKAGYARVLWEAYYRELTRPIAMTNEFEKANSVAFQKKALEDCAKLMPYGYLGDLDQATLLHWSPVIRNLTRQMAADLRDKVTPIWDSINTNAPPDPVRGADIIRKAMLPENQNASDWYADMIVQEIARACKGTPITKADDPRLPLLVSALNSPDNKVKLVVCRVLFDRENKGVTKEARIAAAKALAEAGVYGEQLGRLGFVQDAEMILSLANVLGDKDIGGAFLKGAEEARAKLQATSYRATTVKPDTAKFSYDKKDRIDLIQYPKLPSSAGVAQRSFRRDEEGNITREIIRHGGDSQFEWVRKREGDKLTNEHYRPDKPERTWIGKIDVTPDGTVIETTLSKEGRLDEKAGRVVQVDKIYTNGTRSTVHFNENGKPDEVTFPDGKVINYTYDGDGQLISYQWKGYAAKSLKDGTEVDSNGSIRTVTADNEGNFAKGYNDGTKLTYFVSGEIWDVYVGPPQHTFNGVKAIAATKNDPSEVTAKAISLTIKEFGPIADKNDPRLAALLEASKNESPDIRIAATTVLLDKTSTGVPADVRKQLIDVLVDGALRAVAQNDDKLKDQVARLAAALKNDKDTFDALRDATVTAAKKNFFQGEIKFGDVLTVKVDDASEKQIDAVRSLVENANSADHWYGINQQRRVLSLIAEKHPKIDLRKKAADTLREIKESYRPAWDTGWNSDLSPSDGAKMLAKTLAVGPKTDGWSSDRAVSDMAAACKGSHLLDRDARIPILAKALQHADAKVKLCAASILLDPKNTGVPREIQLAAVEAVAETSITAQLVTGMKGTRADCDWIVANLINSRQDREFGRTFEDALEAARHKHESSKVKPGEFSKLDSSKVTFDDQGKLRSTVYPKIPGARTSTTLARNPQGNVIEEAVERDGNKYVYVRQSKDGQLSNIWKRTSDGKIWEGSIETDSRGTVIETELKNDKPVRKDFYFTDGSTASIEFNTLGKPTKCVYPGGEVLEVTYDEKGVPQRYKASWYGASWYDLVDGFHEKGKECDYTFELSNDGTFTLTGNSGRKEIRHITGGKWKIYEGPPSHTKEAAVQLDKSLKNAKSPVDEAKAITDSIKQGSILADQNDPRLPIIVGSLDSKSREVRLTAAKILLDKDNYGVTVDQRKRAIVALSDAAAFATVSKDEKLKDQVDDIVKMLDKYMGDNYSQYKDYKSLLFKSTREAGERLFLTGTVTFPNGGSIVCEDASGKKLDQLTSNLAKASSGEDWQKLKESYALLEHIAANHPKQDLKDSARKLLDEMRDTFRITWDSTAGEAMPPEQGAELLKKMLSMSPKAENWNADNAIALMAQACKRLPIEGETDPRRELLKAALAFDDPKVRLAAARVLLDPANKGISRTERLEATKTVAAVGTTEPLISGRNGYKAAAEYVLASYINPYKDKEFGEAFEKAARESLERLRATSLKPGEFSKADQSKLTISKTGLVEAIEYPQLPGLPSKCSFLRDENNKVIKQVLVQDGKEFVLTRQSKDNRLTNNWKPTPEGKDWEGTIDVAADGTATRTTLKDGKPLLAEIQFTNGLKASIEFNETGNPTKVVFPNGGILTVKYDATGNKAEEYNVNSKTYPLADGFHEKGTTTDYSVFFEKDGSFSIDYNDGERVLRLLSDRWVIYKGPARHLKEATQHLVDGLKAAKNGDDRAKALSQSIEEARYIKDANDPRLPLITLALKDGEPVVRLTAASILLNADNTGVPESTRKEAIAVVAEVAVGAVLAKNIKLKEQVDKLITSWDGNKYNKEFLACARASGEALYPQGFREISFPGNLSVKLDDFVPKKLDALASAARFASKDADWQDVEKQCYFLADIDASSTAAVLSKLREIVLPKGYVQKERLAPLVAGMLERESRRMPKPDEGGYKESEKLQLDLLITYVKFAQAETAVPPVISKLAEESTSAEIRSIAAAIKAVGQVMGKARTIAKHGDWSEVEKACRAMADGDLNSRNRAFATALALCEPNGSMPSSTAVNLAAAILVSESKKVEAKPGDASEYFQLQLLEFIRAKGEATNLPSVVKELAKDSANAAVKKRCQGLLDVSALLNHLSQAKEFDATAVEAAITKMDCAARISLYCAVFKPPGVMSLERALSTVALILKVEQKNLPPSSDRDYKLAVDFSVNMLEKLGKYPNQEIWPQLIEIAKNGANKEIADKTKSVLIDSMLYDLAAIRTEEDWRKLLPSIKAILRTGAESERLLEYKLPALAEAIGHTRAAGLLSEAVVAAKESMPKPDTQEFAASESLQLKILDQYFKYTDQLTPDLRLLARIHPSKAVKQKLKREDAIKVPMR
jgi:hypothetical protein